MKREQSLYALMEAIKASPFKPPELSLKRNVQVNEIQEHTFGDIGQKIEEVVYH
jgi:hypothetical protein